MRYCHECEVAAYAQNHGSACWVCGGDTYERPISFSAGTSLASHESVECWADRWPFQVTVPNSCFERATTDIGLCDAHYAALVPR